MYAVDTKMITSQNLLSAIIKIVSQYIYCLRNMKRFFLKPGSQLIFLFLSFTFIFTKNLNMKIEVAAPNDIPELVRLINSAYRGEASKKGWTTEADLLDGVRTNEKNLEEIMDEQGLVLLKCLNGDGEIIGSVYLKKHKEKLYLGMLTVQPDLQGFGIGKKLLQASEDHARNNN